MLEQVASYGLWCAGALALSAHRGLKTPLFLFTLLFAVMWAVYSSAWSGVSPFLLASKLGYAGEAEALAPSVWALTDGLQMLALTVVCAVAFRGRKALGVWWAFALLCLFGVQQIAHDQCRYGGFAQWEDYTVYLDRIFELQIAVLWLAAIVGIIGDGIHRNRGVPRLHPVGSNS